MCSCLQYYTGDPFSECIIIQCKLSLLKKINLTINQFLKKKFSSDNVIENPCVPSPCGSNAICKTQNNVGSCTCLPDYFGNPYESCRPECIVNSDCTKNLACIRNKCQNPCPGTCGLNAECQVINHIPSCICNSGFSGDPFKHCNRQKDNGNL